MAAHVPNTDTFTLTDVIAVIPNSGNNLIGCFSKAIDGCFDPNYKGSKNSLLNFRNYTPWYIDLSKTYFEFPNQSYSRDSALVISNINSTSLPAGFKIISSPSWLTVDVYDNINNIVKTGNYYSGDSIRAIPNSATTPNRTGIIKVGNTITNELASISIKHVGRPATGYLHTAFSCSASSITLNATNIYITFTPSNLSSTLTDVGMFVRKDGGNALKFYTTTARNGYQKTHTFSITPEVGSQYDAYVIIGKFPPLDE